MGGGERMGLRDAQSMAKRNGVTLIRLRAVSNDGQGSGFCRVDGARIRVLCFYPNSIDHGKRLTDETHARVCLHVGNSRTDAWIKSSSLCQSPNQTYHTTRAPHAMLPAKGIPEPDDWPGSRTGGARNEGGTETHD